MSAIKIVTLLADERAALEKGAKYGLTPSYRLRCQAVLLKTEPRTSQEVAQQLACCEMSVNNWVNRYQAQGLTGLKTKKGRGRKAILHREADIAAVRKAVQNNRQRLSLAKEELEQELGKQFSTLTLQRFLKKTVAATNECGGR
jgi:transposase